MISSAEVHEPGADDDDAGHAGALSLTLMILSWKASSLTWNDSSTETFTSPIAAALDTSSANSPRAACWYESILRMPTQDPPAVSPTAPVPAARGRGAGLSVEITRGSNPPNAFFPLLRDVRCPVRRARVCAEKRNSRAKPRPGELLHAAWNSRKKGLIFIFLMLHFFPTQSPITLRFHLVLAAYFAIRKLKAHRHSIHSSSAQLVSPARKPTRAF